MQTKGDTKRPLNGLSLPLGENMSAKERLRNERKKCNTFLKGQSGKGKMLQNLTVVSQTKIVANSLHVQLKPGKQPLSRRDAPSLTERRWKTSSDQECEPREQRFWVFQEQHTSVPRDLRGSVALPGQVSQEHGRVQEPGLAMSKQQSRSAVSKDEMRVATGLMIGTAEDDLVKQQKKHRYRLELLDQIAEQQKKKKRYVYSRVTTDWRKIKEISKLILSSHFQQNSAITQERNGSRREVPYRSDLNMLHCPKEMTQPIIDGGMAAGLGGGGLSGQNEDFHKGVSSTLVEIESPRMLVAPPQMLFTLDDHYRTPYNNAYCYYGARTPLAPSLAPALAHGEPMERGAHPMAYFHPLSRPVESTQLGCLEPQAPATGQDGSAPGGMGTGTIPGVTPHKLNYQEALKQQIREREELRKREEANRQHLEAKLAREMETYNPWGRGGGGAPLRDNQGNLIADLKQMHQFNKETCLNPGCQDKQAVPHFAKRTPTPKVGDQPPSPQSTTGGSSAQTSPFTRSNVFTELSERRQLHERQRYKDDLLKQIEEKRRKEAEDRERIRLQEEEDEKRVAKEQAKIRKEYEKEQEKRRQKEVEMMQQAEEWRKQREEKKREEKEKKHKEEEKNRMEEEKKHKEQEKNDRGEKRNEEEKNEEEEEKPEEEKHHREVVALQIEKERPALLEEKKRRESPPPDSTVRKKLATRCTSRQVDSRRTISAVPVSILGFVLWQENAKNGEKKYEGEQFKQEKHDEEKCHREVLKLQPEIGRMAQMAEEQHREVSPPVPTLRKELATLCTFRPPSTDSYIAPSLVSENAKNSEKRHEEEWCKQKHKEEKHHREVLKLQSEMERPAQVDKKQHRQLSPPVPALKNKLAARCISRSPADSHFAQSPVSERSICASQSPEEPANRSLQRDRGNVPHGSQLISVFRSTWTISLTEEHKAVLSQLLVLRRLLRSKQRSVEEELLQTEDEEGDMTHQIR
ncbi:centrosome and spindle pole associated protein 1-like isoform X1 [Arapaima gigas]